jgi:hypothetical protein
MTSVRQAIWRHQGDLGIAGRETFLPPPDIQTPKHK